MALRRGTARVVATGRTAAAVLREADGRRGVVLINPGSDPDTLDLPAELDVAGLRRAELDGWTTATGVSVELRHDGSARVTLPAQSGAVLIG